MIKYLFILLLPAVIFSGCLKDNKTTCVPAEVNIKAPDAEVTALRGFLAGNGITATEDPRGFFYIITSPGTGAKPNSCNGVTVDYVAKLLFTGATVDANTNVTFSMAAFITGWKEALPLLATGGSMTLYLPPSLAYGAQDNGNVPANSNLVFTLSLKAVF